MMTVSIRPLVLKRLPAAAALTSALMLATAPSAWATYVQKIVVTGENADGIGAQEIRFAPTTGAVVGIKQEKDDDDKTSIFTVTLSDDATTEGAVTIGGKTINTPAAGPGETLNIDLDNGLAFTTSDTPAPALAPRQPKTDWLRGVRNPPIIELFGGLYTEDHNLDTALEGGTVVTDNGGVFTDAGANIFVPDGRLDGFQVGGSYVFNDGNLGLQAQYTYAAQAFDYAQTQSVTSANQSAGFAFYGEDGSFGTGLSVGQGDFDTNAFTDIKLNRLDVSLSLYKFGVIGEERRCALYPIVGFEHEKLRQSTEIFSTLTSSFGTLTNTQSIWQSNEAVGPDIGIGYKRIFGDFNISGGIEYQPRWNNVEINADQLVESQIASFPATIAQAFNYDETHFFHGAEARVGIGYTPPFAENLELKFEGGVRRRALYQFGQQTDGFGRPGGVYENSQWSPRITLSARVKF